MIRSRAVPLIAGMLMAGVSQLWCQSATRGAIILTLPTSPRALGLADASAAAVPDAWAMFAAPSQLARVRGPAAGLASEAYLASTQLSATAIAIPLGRGTLALGATLLDYGTIQEIASTAPGTDGVETGRTYGAQDNAIVMAYGLPVTWIDGLALGGSLEFVNSRIADLSSRGVAGSASLSWSSRNGWDVTAGVLHVGPEFKLGATRAPLPSVVRAAVAAPAHRVRGFFVRPLAELRSDRGDGASFAAAAEGEWSGSNGAGLTLRAGYALRSEAGDRSPFALGAGIALGSWAIDYAPQRFAEIGQTTHRVGVRYARRSPNPR